MNRRELLQSISGDLNDVGSVGGRVWSDALLSMWVSEAITIITTTVPKLFTHTEICKVPTCAEEQLTNVVHVYGVYTKCGSFVSKLRKQSLDTTTAWTGNSIKCHNGTFRITSYAIDSMGTLHTFPTVPCGAEIYIKVGRTLPPDADDFTDTIIPMIRQWVLWRAKSMDADASPMLKEISMVHYQAFYKLLGDVESRHAREESTK